MRLEEQRIRRNVREKRNERGRLRVGGRATVDGKDVVENALERDPLNGDLHQNRLCLSDPPL